MATGKLGANNLAAATDTVVYTVPANTFAVVTLSICNRNATNVAIRAAVADAATPTTAEFIEFDAELLSNGVLERTGIVMNAGQNLVVRSDTINVSAVAMGIETTVA